MARRRRNTGSVFFRSSRASTRPWEARWAQDGRLMSRMFHTKEEALIFMDGFTPNSREAWLDLIREHLWFRLQWRYESESR